MSRLPGDEAWTCQRCLPAPSELRDRPCILIEGKPQGRSSALRLVVHEIGASTHLAAIQRWARQLVAGQGWIRATTQPGPGELSITRLGDLLVRTIVSLLKT